MVAVSKLPRLLAFFRHILSRLFVQGGISVPEVFRKIIQKIVVLLSIFWKGKRKPDTSEEISRDGGPEYHISNKSNSEVVSVNKDVAFSLYPFSGGIRNASRSSQNLRLSRSAHNIAVAGRNASRASHHNGGSDYSTSAYTVSNYEEEGPYTITVQPNSPTSPTPVRQWSISLPQLPGTSNSNHDDTQPRPLSNTIEMPVSNVSSSPEVSSPQEMEITSLHIPTRPSTPQSIPPLRYLDNNTITPVMPESTQRYIKRPCTKKEYSDMTIEPITINFDKPLPPPGWTKYIHLEGARYFYNKAKRICTDADLQDPKILSHAERDILTIEQFILDNNVIIPEQSDLVLNVFYDEGELITTYYYAHHPSRTIFFLDQYRADNMTAYWEVVGVKTKNHLYHEIHAQYWYFVQLYPHTFTNMTKENVAELRGAALHFIGDSMTSPTSTAPYTTDDLYKILSLTNNMDKNVDTQDDGVKSLYARLMYVFMHSRFLDWHGEPHARIERNFSVYGMAINSRTWLVKSLSMVLFFAPDFHLRMLQNMWVDNIMHKSVWHESMRKMHDEWQEFVLFATVMLNANVAFLAIQSVDIEIENYRSAAQISSYMSVVASIGSIVLGLLLIRQNRTKNRESVDDVQLFLTRISHPRLGLETLAILYSLPYALLMWGMVCFLAAFSFVCFQDSSSATRALVGSLCFVVVVLVAWCVKTSWEEHPLQEEPGDISPTPEGDLTSIVNVQSLNNDRKSMESIGHTDEANVSKPTFLSRLTSFLSYRRESYDSQRTAVNARV